MFKDNEVLKELEEIIDEVLSEITRTPEDAADFYNGYWSSAEGALTSATAGLAERSSRINKDKSIESRNNIPKTSREITELSRNIDKYIARLDELNAKNAEHGIIRTTKLLDGAKEKHRDALLKHMSSIDKTYDYSKAAKYMANLEKYASRVGHLADIANYSLKLKEGDYYGAASVGITFLTMLKASPWILRILPFMPGGIPLILIGAVATGAASHVIDKIYNVLLKRYDPLGINPKTNTHFQDAQNFVLRIDPRSGWQRDSKRIGQFRHYF